MHYISSHSQRWGRVVSAFSRSKSLIMCLTNNNDLISMLRVGSNQSEIRCHRSEVIEVIELMICHDPLEQYQLNIYS